MIVLDIKENQAEFDDFGTRFRVRGIAHDKMEQALSVLKKGCTSEALSALIGDDSAKALLQQLENFRLLEIEAPSSMDEDVPDSWRDFLAHFGDPAKRTEQSFAQRIRHSKVHWHPLEGVALSLEQAFDQKLSPVFAPADSADLIIVGARWCHLDELDALNRKWHRERRWIALIEDEFGGTLTPLFGGEADPCWSCLRSRRSANFDEQLGSMEDYFSRKELLQRKIVPTFTRMLEQTAVLEIMKVLGGFSFSFLEKGLYRHDFLNHRSEFHEVHPFSGCPVCVPDPVAGQKPWHSFVGL